MVRVSAEDMEVAAMWLDANNGRSGEMEACQRVRDWLRREAARREDESVARSLAKEAGVHVSVAREKMRKAIP